jgi:FkbM family methyltransferase
LRRAELATIGRVPALRRVEREVSMDFDGARIVLPVFGGIGPQHRALVDGQLRGPIRAALSMRTGAFVDVGAHLGETLIKLLSIDPDRPYLGFEPQLPAAEYVRRLLRANGVHGSVVGAALSDRNGATPLLLDGALHGGATVVERFRDTERYRERWPVPVLRGDDAVEAASIGTVGVLKIDAEGAELEVLSGFAETLERDRPIILCEILPPGDPSTDVGRFRKQRADAALELIRGKGYRVIGIGPDGRVADAERMLAASAFAERDYAFVPEVEAARFTLRVDAPRDRPS